MFRNYLAAAVRNLARNKVVAAINIAGLAIGFAAAILIGLYVRYELSYENFIPGHERTYRLSMIQSQSGAAQTIWDTADYAAAQRLKNDFPEVELSARMVDHWVSLRRGAFEANEQIFVVDPDFLRVVPVKSVAGDLATALEAPDGLVMSRSMARKYFGEDAPLGRTLEVYRKFPLRVTAVIEDLPGNSHFNFALLASGKAPFASTYNYDRWTEPPPLLPGAHTYFRLREGASIDRLESELPAFVERHYAAAPGAAVRFVVYPIEDIHLKPAGRWPLKPAGNPQTLVSLSVVAVLIVLIAAINFVNLMTSRAAQRGVEVGVRKAAGARRRDLFVQFMSESVLYALAAMVLAIAIVELALPWLNAMLEYSEPIYPQATVTFAYWSDARVAATILAAALGVGVLAGAYPALVMSGFRPVAALKRDGAFGGASWVRQALVVVQFAILVGLMYTTAVIHRQTTFAMNDALRIDRDQVLLIHFQSVANEAFRHAVAELSGVLDVTSAVAAPTNYDITAAPFRGPNDARVAIQFNPVDYNFFEFYRLRPVAGRTFSRERGTDLMRFEDETSHWSVVINETAAHALGFAEVKDAVGQPLVPADWAGTMLKPPASITIVGVVPDFPVSSVREPIQPALYGVDPSLFQVVSVRLTGERIPETLEAIDAIWARLGEPRGNPRWFLEEYYQRMYQDVVQQRRLLASLSAIAVFLACLGLFGLSIFMAQRRTKEIGVRKALGAQRNDILALLLWSFSKPVLWANVIAWPIAAYLMQRWLNAFAYRVDLGWWLLPLASLAALAIALLTVSAHSYLVARSKPVEALRYE